MRYESLLFTKPLFEAGLDYSVFKLRHLQRKDELENEFFISAHLSLVLTAWRKEVNIPRKTLLESGGLELWSLMRYWINLYDDTIDNTEQTNILTREEIKHGYWKEDKRISDVTSLLVQKVQSLPVSSRKKDFIFNTLGNFRREQYCLYEQMHLLVSLPYISVQQLEHTKLLSGALTMRRMAEIMNILTDVPIQRAKEVEDGFHVLGLAGQWIDDIADFEKDKGNVTNLIVAVMIEFPDEYNRCVEYGFSRASYHRAVKTKKAAKERFYLSMASFPDNCPVLKNSLYFFYDLAPLYELFETESRIQY